MAETTPVASAGDAADDAAIWLHPEDPGKSLVLGTDKQRGLEVYDLDGRLLQSLPDGRLNNVDLRDGFRFENRRYALVAATNRSNRAISLYLLDPATSRLRSAGPPVPTGFADPYGLCMYASPGGEYFVFASEAGSGHFRQWRIRDEGGAVVAEPVRRFSVGSQAEGCVADDASGALYVAEEGVGLWRYAASADAGAGRRSVDRIGSGSGLTPDLEGIAIWPGPEGHGYLVLSNQGANNYAVYRREGDNAFVGLFRILERSAAGLDGVSGSDGLEITSASLNERYDRGLMVVQDGSNEPAGQHQNFKLVSWVDIEQGFGLRSSD